MIRFHARDLSGDDRHMRGGDHRIAPARHITADRIHRNVPMAKDDARQRLDLEVVHRFALLLGEVAHLCLRKLDVIEVAFGDLRYGALDLLRGKAKILWRPFVEFLGQLANGRVLPLIDLREDAFDGFAHFGIGGLYCARIHSAFEPTGHGFILPVCRNGDTTRFAKLKRLMDPRVKPGGGACLYYLLPYLMACGLIGDPVPPVMIKGGPQKKNS
jgi:hypothetical protein